MSGQPVASINGRIIPLEQAKISVLDHGLLYGDGVFEGIRLTSHGVLFHREHTERLYASSRALEFTGLASSDVYEQWLFEAIRSSGFDIAYLRVLITRGCGELDIDPRKCLHPTLIIIVDRLKLYPKELFEDGLHVIIAQTRKIPKACIDGQIKSCNYLNNIMATLEYLKAAGAREALMVGTDGFLSEGTVDNVFGVEQGALFTPDLSTNCLAGITRRAVIQIAREIGLHVEELRCQETKFERADEVFLTGTGAGVVPVTKVGDRVIGDGKAGPVTKRLRLEFEKRMPQFCTPVPARIRA